MRSFVRPSYHRLRATAPAGLVAAGALIVSLVLAGTAQAHLASLAQSRTPASAAITPAQYPSWYVTPLTAKQIKHEVSVPSDPTKVTGKLRLTTADYEDYAGGLAISPKQAYPIKIKPAVRARELIETITRPLVPREAIQLAGNSVFSFGGAQASDSTTAELKKLSTAFHYVTGATCEGYTSYGEQSAAADVRLGLSRAKVICALLHKLDHKIKVRSVSYGDKRPAVVGGTIAERAADRRVVIVITSATASVPPVPVVAATPDDARVALSITPAAATPAITAYEYSLNAGKTWSPLGWGAGNPISASITGLTDGTQYSITVRAGNLAGYSDPSAPMTAIPIAPVVPGAPTITGNSEVTQVDAALNLHTEIDFSGGSEGSSPVTEWLYSVSGGPFEPMNVSYDGGGDFQGEADFAVVNPCDGYSTSIQIEAVNAVGDSLPSAAWDVTGPTYGCGG